MAKATLVFEWQGKDRKGNSQKGELSAINIAEAKSLLRRRGISANRVRKQSASLFKRKQKIKAADISIVSRQIATMLSAGVSLIQSLEMISQGHANPAARKLLSEITDEVRAGNPLSSALRKHPDYFDDLYCDLVYTGEQSGALETIYDRIATYKEKAEALKSKIKKAMFYPIAVVVVALIVTTILLIFVVPQFEEIFSSFGAELPGFTLLVLGISNFVQSYGIFIGICISVAGYLFMRAHKKSQSFRDRVDRAVLKIPVIGEILKKASIARFTRTLATTFAAGVPLIGALESAAGASGNAVFRDAILYIRKEVAGGMPMFISMRATNVFPDMVTQMVAIGEESGSVEEMLSKIATIYEAEVDDMVDGLTSLLEPMIMAVLGVVIGGLIIAMYLPIFEMGNVV
ncbi:MULTISPECIES: type II secretion system F family protein [Alteromonas]|uniref:Type II secretion system F family protein n=1 Tax=Alteromonas stellipolaris TaxID=233316 RepID=A0AAW7Z4S8_9ALTE|nr:MULTISPECIES: type II secretion system F family protein [Alteromonas]AMJ91672.1 type II secretion system protein F [Alteromonas sp. Mac2]ALM89493.1 Type IV fimbrial assembly protein PilC [Alteromonas stellipolaris LMG 21856]AMJ75385.1 type II secretion system protein F [Alteromonas stellipolaris]AMJ87808.1 type II secretion system protein F [Alteromonas sp. Mac1]ANB21481.1 type II secretion system protein F [Alteromonas stellipolaris]